MKLVTSTALALVMATSAAPAAAQGYGSSPPPQQMPEVPRQQAQQAAPAQAQQKGPQPSKKALKALIDLQDAVNKNDAASIPAKVAAAQAVAQTKEDDYLIGRLQLTAAVAAKDNAAISTAIDAIAASNYLDAAKLSDLYVGLGGALYNNKQFAQAAAAYERALAINPQNAEAAGVIADAYMGAGQNDKAIHAMEQYIQARVAAGQKPDEPFYHRAWSLAYQAQSPAAMDLAREWVVAYPNADHWTNAIDIYRNYNLGDTEANLDALRLKQALGILTPGEYSLLARTAADQLIFGEAQAALSAGIAAHAIDPASPEQRDLVAGLRAKPKLTAADLTTAMKIAANAKALMRIGDNFAAMGDYASAVQAYKLAMARPDGDAALANLHIGMALARSGDKAGAAAALNAVTGPRAAMAKYWLTYLALKA